MDLETLSRNFDNYHQNVADLVRKSNSAIEEQSARLLEIEQRLVRPGGFAGQIAPLSLGEEVTKSASFQAFVENGCRGQMSLITKAITSGPSSAGAMVQPDFRGALPMATRPLTIRDLVAPGSTTSNSVVFARQTSRTIAAAMVAEGAVKPESAMAYTEATAPVRTLAHWLPVSRQIFDDAPALQSLINADLTFGLDSVEEVEILTGDGTGQHLLGLVPQATTYSAPFVVEDETPIDRVLLAASQAQNSSYLRAEALVIHPNDWAKIRLIKDGLGRYICGGPSAPLPDNIWGLRLVATPVMAEGQFLVGNFRQSSQIFDRQTTEILISAEASVPGPSSTIIHAFVQNMLIVRAERRLALAVKYPGALVAGDLYDA